MKFIIGAALLILLFSLPATAQGYYGNYGNVGGGPSLNSGASLNNYTGYSGVGNHSLSSNPVTTFHMTVVDGAGNEFIPSTYVPFEQAVARGRATLTAKPKTLAEVAAENRAVKKPKAELAFVQDNSGRAIPQKR